MNAARTKLEPCMHVHMANRFEAQGILPHSHSCLIPPLTSRSVVAWLSDRLAFQPIHGRMRAEAYFSNTHRQHYISCIIFVRTLASYFHYSWNWVLHEEQIKCMATVCSKILPPAAHFTLPCHRTSKVFIPVAPACSGIHTWLAAELKEEMCLWLAPEAYPISNKMQSMALQDKGLTA